MARKSRKGQQNNSEIVNSKPIFTAGLYARISVNPDGKNTSVMGQVEYMREFLAQNENITVYDIYIDDGISSFAKHRPAFTKMISDMNDNKINCIIVNDISRFSRNYIETSEYLEITFPLRQVRFISIFDGYDSLRGDSERLLIMLKTLLAYAYAKELSNKIGTVFKGKQRTGKYTPAQLPYGYRKYQNGDQIEWIADEEKVIIVRKIFEMAKQGFSGYSIAKELNLQGVPSPKSTNWTSVSVRRVLETVHTNVAKKSMI